MHSVIAFASATPIAVVHRFTPALSPRTPLPRHVCLPSSARVRWHAVAGGAPTTPPRDDDDDTDESANPMGGSSGEESAASPLPGSGPFGTVSDTVSSPRSDDGSRDAEFDLEESASADTEPPNELFNFVKSVPPPELVQKFTQSAPPVVQNAIRETLVSMLGSLPPMAFSTTVSTMSSNLVQLFHSSLVTGYMFRNASYRLELTRSIDWSGLRALPSSPEAQPEIRGGVAFFKQDDGSTIEVPVEKYIGELRDTVNNLQGELQRERKGGNELLSFISTMEKDAIDALTKNAGDEVVDAMKKVCEFVTKTQGINAEANNLIEASAPELGQLLFYLMVSGFFLREAEVHLDLQRKLGGDGSSLNNLLEGDNDSQPNSS